MNTPEPSDAAIEAALQQWRFVAELPQFEPAAGARGVSDEYRERIAEQNRRAVAKVLSSAVPHLRAQWEDELLSSEALRAAVLAIAAEAGVAPSAIEVGIVRGPIEAALTALRGEQNHD